MCLCRAGHDIFVSVTFDFMRKPWLLWEGHGDLMILGAANSACCQVLGSHSLLAE